MILSGHLTEFLLIFPPIFNDVRDFVSLYKLLPNIIRATNFIELSYAIGNLE